MHRTTVLPGAALLLALLVGCGGSSESETTANQVTIGPQAAAPQTFTFDDADASTDGTQTVSVDSEADMEVLSLAVDGVPVEITGGNCIGHVFPGPPCEVTFRLRSATPPTGNGRLTVTFRDRGNGGVDEAVVDFTVSRSAGTSVPEQSTTTPPTTPTTPTSTAPTSTTSSTPSSTTPSSAAPTTTTAD
jgi:hypothetical protein